MTLTIKLEKLLTELDIISVATKITSPNIIGYENGLQKIRNLIIEVKIRARAKHIPQCSCNIQSNELNSGLHVASCKYSLWLARQGLVRYTIT